MTQRSLRDSLFSILDDDASAKVWRRIQPMYLKHEPTLLVYNTVERLLSGDLVHTVSIDDVWADLFPFPHDWVVVGIGTTDWLRRNGEMMPDGTAREIRFWWADPKSAPQAHIIDLDERPPEQDIAEGTLVKRQARFPFLALGICDPKKAITWKAENVPDLHEWLKARLKDAHIPLAALKVAGTVAHMTSSDAHYIPDTGIDLSAGGGHDQAEYFRVNETENGTWNINGLYAADETLHPLISVRGKPVHLHGYEIESTAGGHINRAQGVTAEVTVWKLRDVVMKLVVNDPQL